MFHLVFYKYNDICYLHVISCVNLYYVRLLRKKLVRIVRDVTLYATCVILPTAGYFVSMEKKKEKSIAKAKMARRLL